MSDAIDPFSDATMKELSAALNRILPSGLATMIIVAKIDGEHVEYRSGERNMSAPQVAALLLTVLACDYGIRPVDVITFMHSYDAPSKPKPPVC